MRGFKFMRREHVADFLSGRVRIGVPEEYRVADGMIGGRSDDDECAVRWRPPAGVYRGDQARAYWAEIVGAEHVPTANFEVHFPETTSFVRQSYCYLFSFSSSISRLMASKMRELFGYDACVQILDDDAFALALTKSDPRLRREAGSSREWDWVSGKIEYRSTVVVGKRPDGGVFVKGTAYRWQSEARIIWPGPSSREAFFTQSRDIAAIVREVDLSRYS